VTRPETAGHSFLAAWREYRPAGLPYILPGDEVLLEPKARDRWTSTFGSWEEYSTQKDFGSSDGGRLHLGLIPMPFVGDLLEARAYVLLLNPGLDPLDYYAESSSPDYRAALLANLAQSPDRGMLFLDPAFAFHSGYRYWHGRLTRVIQAVAKQLGQAYGEARRLVQRRFCAIELYPYHSTHWDLPDRIAARLHSATLVRRFVHEVALPRARAGDATVLVTRRAKAWGIDPAPGVVVYEGMARRGAYLGPKSDGGRALIEQFVRS
jgi:hypothetical protein